MTVIYARPPDGWVCFHCGERFTSYGTAEMHFGARPEDMAACRIKLGTERGLVMALRKSEAEVRRLRELLCHICRERSEDVDLDGAGLEPGPRLTAEFLEAVQQLRHGYAVDLEPFLGPLWHGSEEVNTHE